MSLVKYFFKWSGMKQIKLLFPASFSTLTEEHTQVSDSPMAGPGQVAYSDGVVRIHTLNSPLPRPVFRVPRQQLTWRMPLHSKPVRGPCRSFLRLGISILPLVCTSRLRVSVITGLFVSNTRFFCVSIFLIEIIFNNYSKMSELN